MLLPLLFKIQTGCADDILVIGDSISAAYGMPIEQGWVHKLQQRLADIKPSHRLINASISGDTSANARTRLKAIITKVNPDIVIIEIGGNDALRGLSLETMRDNLADMINTIQQHQAQVLLVGMDIPPNYGPVYTEKFRTVYRELAETYQVTLLPSLLDGIGTKPDLMQADGIHPNSKAQPLIANLVAEYLLPMLEVSTGSRSTD